MRLLGTKCESAEEVVAVARRLESGFADESREIVLDSGAVFEGHIGAADVERNRFVPQYAESRFVREGSAEVAKVLDCGRLPVWCGAALVEGGCR